MGATDDELVYAPIRCPTLFRTNVACTLFAQAIAGLLLLSAQRPRYHGSVLQIAMECNCMSQSVSLHCSLNADTMYHCAAVRHSAITRATRLGGVIPTASLWTDVCVSLSLRLLFCVYLILRETLTACLCWTLACYHLKTPYFTTWFRQSIRLSRFANH